MKILAVLSLCACTAAAAFPAYAAPAAPAGPSWTLESCIRTALEKHGDVVSASDSLQAASAQVRSAGSSLLYPKLTAESSLVKGQADSQRLGTTSTSDQQNRLRLGVTFYDGGVQRENVRRARAGEANATAGLDRARQTLAYNVTSAYIGLLRAQRSLKVADEKLADAEGQKTMVQARIKAGAAAEVDIYPIEVQIADARVQRIKGANDVRVAGSALRNAMGLDPGGVPEVADLPDPAAAVPALDACLKQAQERRPEILQARAAVDQQQAGLNLARLNLKPQLNVGAGLDRGFATGGGSSPNTWDVSATLSWSLYDRADRANVDAAKASVAAADAQARQVEKDVAAEVEQAYLSLTSAGERVAAAAASVTMARKNLEVAEARYKQGLAIPIEIVDAQVAFSDAQLQSIGARYDYLLARAQLDRAVGNGVTE